MPERAFTQWSPDTCGCVIQYYNDDQTHHATVVTCPKHAAAANTPQHLADVRAHNQNKNYVVKHLMDQLGVTADKFPLVVTYDPAASVDDDPVIVVGLTQANKDTITTDAAQFSLSLSVGGGTSRKVVNGGGAVDVTGTAGTLTTASGDVSVLLV